MPMRSLFKNTPATWLHRLGLIFFLLIVFCPLAGLTADTMSFLVKGSRQGVALALPVGRRLTLFVHSILLALGVSVGGTVLGVLAGSALWQWRSRVGRYLRWVVVLLFAIPPYVHALSWMTVINGLDAILRSIGCHTFPSNGWIFAWWVDMMHLTPIGIGMALLGLESVDARLLEAAHIMGSESDGFLKIALPLAKPLILAGSGFMFLISLVDYTVPSLFQVNVYALEIFAEYSATNEPASALLLALPLILTTIFVLTFSQSQLRRAALKPLWRIGPRPVTTRPPAWLKWAQVTALALTAVQILLPLTVLTLSVGTWENMITASGSAVKEMTFTFWISLLTAGLALPAALAAARELAKEKASTGCWWFLVTAPLALPSPLIGIGLITLWNRPMAIGVYGSIIMPILACLARFTPFAALVLSAQLRRIDPLLLDAARIFRSAFFRAWSQIHFPMIAPGLLASACILFALSAGELGATLLVAPPGRATLTMRIYNYLHYGASERVAGLCLVMAFCALCAGLLAAFTLRSWRHLFPPFFKR